MMACLMVHLTESVRVQCLVKIAAVCTSENDGRTGGQDVEGDLSITPILVIIIPLGRGCHSAHVNLTAITLAKVADVIVSAAGREVMPSILPPIRVSSVRLR